MYRNQKDRMFKTDKYEHILCSMDFQSTYFILLVIMLFHLSSIKNLSNIYIYIMSFSFFSMTSILFIEEMKNNILKQFFYYFCTIFSLPSIAFYLLFIMDFSYTVCFFLLIILFVMMFVFNGIYYLWAMIAGAGMGAVLYAIDSGDWFFHRIEYEKLEVACISTLLSFLFWRVFFVRIEKNMNMQEDNFKTISCAINHEINTSLSSLRITLSSIEEKVDVDGKEDDVITCIRRCEKIIQNINVISEVMHMNFQDYLPKAHWETFEISEEIKKIVGDYPFDSKMIGKVSVSGDSFFVLNNKSILRNIIFNLLQNAIFFIKKAGKGQIEIKTIKSDCENNILVFRDTGYGVRPEFLDHIFDKFFSRRKTGTGFGLFFCKKAMLYFGGDITCTSRLSEFTEFRLIFPKT